MGKRVLYIDSIKGIACLFIVLHHFNYDFYIETNQDISSVILSIHEMFRFLLNGRSMVALFCIISGYFVSWKISTIREVVIYSIRRYIRLVIPLLVICLSIYCINKVTFIDNSWLMEYLESTRLILHPEYYSDIKSAIFESFIGIIFLERSFFVLPTWMLKSMMYGQILLACNIYIYNKFEKKTLSYICMAISALAAAIWAYPCLAAFVGGVYRKFEYRMDHKVAQKYVAIFLVILLLIGHSEIYFIETDVRLLARLSSTILVAILFGIFYCVKNIDKLTELLSKRAFVALGKLSVGVYFLHRPVFVLFSCNMFMLVLNQQWTYSDAYVVIEVLTILVILLAAWIWSKTVDPFTMWVSNQFKKI